MAVQPPNDKKDENKEEIDYKSKYDDLNKVHMEQRIQIEAFRKIMLQCGQEYLEIATKALNMHYTINKIFNPSN